MKPICTTDLARSDVPHRDLFDLMRHCAGLAGSRALACVDDLDLSDIKNLLPRLLTIEVFGGIYRVAHCGSLVATLSGKDHSNSILADRIAGIAGWRRQCDEVLAAGRPLYQSGAVASYGRGDVLYQRLLIPFVGLGAGPALIVAAIHREAEPAPFLRQARPVARPVTRSPLRLPLAAVL
jgi:hypothetical protein